MYSTPDQPQQWSVHAEFTISHPGVGNPSNPARTNTVHDDKGVRMLYSWSANDNPNTWSTSSQNNPSEAGSCRSSDKQYVFQKGNIVFTSTPPTKSNQRTGPVLDSGYGSDLLSPTSFASSALPKTGSHPFNRKCRSTCNIILSGNTRHQGQGATHCGRSQSLRCQTPAACCDKRSENFYGCGDPWCHHLHYADEFATTRRVSPVREDCEDFQEVSHEDCDRSCVVGDPDRKVLSNLTAKRDVSVQTFEMVNKCTSPMLKMEDSAVGSSNGRNGSRLKRGRTIGRADSLKFSPVPPSMLADKIFQKDLPKLSRSPTSKKTSPALREKKSSGSDTKSGDSSKKPRTIHIDVYCTGTDLESDSSCGSSSSSSHSKSVSTPQTVFESDKVCITHKKADDKIIPRHLSKGNDTSLEREDSDDGGSTGYPSKVSSYSTIGQSLSSMSSFPNSAAYSMSSCTVPDYDSSAANTSWKDTFSDLDSLLQSRNSIAGNDSVYFIPKKIVEENGSGCESPKTGTTNSVSLHPSDSFEYANSEDRLRIKRMERMWKNKPNWKEASKNKTAFLRQEKLQEAVNKRLSQMNVSKDSDSDLSDDSEKGWTFLKNKDEMATAESVTPVVTPSKKPIPQEPNEPQQGLSKEESTFLGSLSDSSSPPCRSPSSVVFRQRLSLNPDLRSPFTIVPGKYTESRFIAKKFGPIINVYKKPGHHIGPAKNPDCLCDHCRRHYKESVAARNRTSSVGDTPKVPPGQDWGNVAKPDQKYSDF